MKFAYLILAHGSFGLFKELLKVLDSPDNDIYVHIDQKVGDMDYSPFLQIVKHSRLVFITNRVDVVWGNVSIVEATLNLLAEAIKGEYDYYHLLSGVDFPIKSQSYIQSFFKAHAGKEFVGFSKALTSRDMAYRTRYHLIKGRVNNLPRIIRLLNGLFLRLQLLLHISSVSAAQNVKGGAEWFSITHALAKDLVSQTAIILKRYKYSLIPDEMFLQTYLSEHHDMDKVLDADDEFASCCRNIDWQRGQPYVWQEGDYDELVESKYLWARKFSEDNMDLIRRITKYISEQKYV